MEKAQIAAEFLKAKRAEEKAKEKRLEIEARLIEAYGLDFESASKTFSDEKFKVTIKKSASWTMDQKKYAEIRTSIPSDRRPEKVKFELDKAGYEWLRDNDAETYQRVAEAVTYKENKPTVSVEKA